MPHRCRRGAAQATVWYHLLPRRYGAASLREAAGVSPSPTRWSRLTARARSSMNMKILIVEDNAGVRRMIRRAVDHLASQVSECEDGADALAAYRECLPDIVLMDIRMPKMDGLAATR